MKLFFGMLLALALFNPVSAAAQGLFKCTQGEKIVYQAEYCGAGAKQDELKSGGYAVSVPAASSASTTGPTTAAAASAANPEVTRILEFMSTYKACASAIQIWGQEMAGPYQEWRSRNAAAVSQIENDARLSAIYQQRVDAKRNGKAGMCRDVALELRGKK